MPEGLLVTIRQSKTDQESVSRKVGIPYGKDEATCPVRALTIYKEAASIESGYLFRAIDQIGRVSALGLHRDSVGYVLKRAAARAGLTVEDIAGHSFRSGFCTEAARQNVPEYLIRRQARFKPGSRTLDRYIRLGEMFTRNAASGLSDPRSAARDRRIRLRSALLSARIGQDHGRNRSRNQALAQPSRPGDCGAVAAHFGLMAAGGLRTEQQLLRRKGAKCEPEHTQSVCLAALRINV